MTLYEYHERLCYIHAEYNKRLNELQRQIADLDIWRLESIERLNAQMQQPSLTLDDPDVAASTARKREE